MTLDVALRELMLSAAREALAHLRAEIGRSRLLPIRETPISYRAILAAERAGELKVYRVGHASFVDECELYDWIRRVGARVAAPASAPKDEIANLIEMGDARRARKGHREGCP